MQWYYSFSGQQAGPVSPEEMKTLAKSGTIQPETLIWRSGLPNWTPASEVAELELVFGVSNPPPLSSGAGPMNARAAVQQGSPVSSTGPFVASIITTLFCCLPFGIPGIIYAAKIGSKNAQGDYNGAKEASRIAYVWSCVALGVGMFLIPLWAAMAIPAFNRVREQSRQITLVNDGRMLGNAAQQYFLTTGTNKVAFTYDPVSGNVTGDLSPWVRFIGKGYTVHDNIIESGSSDAFSISLPGAFGGEPVSFNDEGKTDRNPSEHLRRR